MMNKDSQTAAMTEEQARRVAFETGNASYQEYQARIHELETQLSERDTSLRRARAESALQKAGLSAELADLIDCSNDDSIDAAFETIRHAGLGKWEAPPTPGMVESEAEDNIIRAAMELD